MRAARQVVGVALLNMKWIVRQPLWMVQGLVAAVGYLEMMFAWGGTAAVRNLVIAWVMAGAWSNGLNLIAQVIGWDRIDYSYEMYVASPVSLSRYFAGVVLGNLPFFLVVNAAPALLLAVACGLPLASIALLFALAPVALVLGAFTSISVVLRIRNPTNISAITNPLNTLTVLLPPVYYPLAALPQCLHIPLLAVPTVALVELARWMVGYPHTCVGPLLPLLSLVAWFSIAVPLAFSKMKWGLE